MWPRLRYLRVRYGMQWPDLRNLRKAIRVGEVLILPVTGFSPGVGNFGAGEVFGMWQGRGALRLKVGRD